MATFKEKALAAFAKGSWPLCENCARCVGEFESCFIGLEFPGDKSCPGYADLGLGPEDWPEVSQHETGVVIVANGNSGRMLGVLPPGISF